MTARRWQLATYLAAFLTIQAILSVAAHADPTTAWEFDTDVYYFDAAPYGSGATESHTFTLENTGETPITAKTWGVRWSTAWPEDPTSFPVTSSDCRNRKLDPGESCSVAVAFDPLHAGWAEGRVMVKSQNEEVAIASVTLHGEGTGPTIPVTPEQLRFGPVAVGATSPPQVVTLEEQSTFYEYRLDSFFFTPVDGLEPSTGGPFRVVGGTCKEGLQLDLGKTCTIEIVMAPTEAGAFHSKLEINDVAPDSPQSVEIEGIATPAPLATSQPPGSGPQGGAVPGEAAAQPVTPSPAVSSTGSVTRPRHRCPRGKRRVVRKGRRICVTSVRHHKGRDDAR